MTVVEQTHERDPAVAALRLGDLARAGRLCARDLDVIVVAWGQLDLTLVDRYLHGERFAPAGGEAEVVAAAREIVERICGCQYQDGGGTELVHADAKRVALRVTGTCVHCPQIRYTIGILRSALEWRCPRGTTIEIDGTRFGEKLEVPPDNQLTMAMFMKAWRVTFDDLDEFLRYKGRLVDADFLPIARLLQIRRGAEAPARSPCGRAADGGAGDA